MDQWSLFAKDDYPREVRSVAKWITVKTNEEYLGFVKQQFENRLPAHTSIFPASTPRAYACFWIDVFPIELDPKRIYPEGYWGMRTVVEYLEKEYSAKPRVYFSGNRSFHVYADFLTLIVDRPMERLKALTSRIATESRVRFIDYQIYTERHLIRIPYTINEKSQHLAIGIDPSWDMEKIAKYSIKGPEEFPIRRIEYSNEIRKAVKEIKLREPETRGSYRASSSGSSVEWIERLLQHPIPDGRHRILWHVIAPYLMNVKGLDLDQAFEVARDYFMKCNQLNPLSPSVSQFERTVRYHLKYAQSKQSKPQKLETIRERDPQLYELIKGAIGNG